MFTSTQTSTNTSIKPEIRFEIDYMKSIHGMLKIVLLVFGIVNLITISISSGNHHGTAFFTTTVVLAWWFTLIMLILFLFHVPEKFYTLPWLPIEIGAFSIICLLYFISSLIVIMQRDVAHTFAGIFGLITTAIYGYSGFLKFKAWKNGELAQGTLTRSTTTTTQSSAYPA